MGITNVFAYLRTVIALAFLGVSGTVFAGTTTSSANSTILVPLTIVKNIDMNFGSLVAGTTGGTAVLSANTGVVTSTGSVVVVPSATTYAQFALDAKGAVLVTINWNPTITLTRSGGLQTMIVNPTSYATNATIINGVNYIPANGILTINLGGTLNVGANQTPGSYSGTVTMTANFQ